MSRRSFNAYQEAFNNLPCPLISTIATILNKGREGAPLDFTSGSVLDLVLKSTKFPTMATILKKRPKPLTPLDLTSGSVLVLKSTNFSLPKSLFTEDVNRKKIQLDLYNENGDILLSITFDTGMSGKQHEIRCNDRALTSFGDGWGNAQKVDESYVDFEGWKKSGVTISVHHYSTDSEFGRYQILLGDVTICNFDQVFRGPVAQISYTGNVSLGPDSWTFSVFRVSDLHPRERQFIAPQR